MRWWKTSFPQLSPGKEELLSSCYPTTNRKLLYFGHWDSHPFLSRVSLSMLMLWQIRPSNQCRYCVKTKGHIVALFDTNYSSFFLSRPPVQTFKGTHLTAALIIHGGRKILEISPFISKKVRDRPI